MSPWQTFNFSSSSNNLDGEGQKTPQSVNLLSNYDDKETNLKKQTMFILVEYILTP